MEEVGPPRGVQVPTAPSVAQLNFKREGSASLNTRDFIPGSPGIRGGDLGRALVAMLKAAAAV